VNRTRRLAGRRVAANTAASVGKETEGSSNGVARYSMIGRRCGTLGEPARFTPRG
jgi:hypothetical protein